MSKPGKFTAMISATAFDLPVHREKVQEACLGEEIFPLWMKHLPARDATGIQVSMEMVDKADIYIGIYAWRYGWVPEFDNPDRISITEMEFNRAVQRKAEGKLKEILIFIVHDDHLIRRGDVEDGHEPQQKLKAFQRRASEGRVRETFVSPEDLQTKVTRALSAFLKSQGDAREGTQAQPNRVSAIPTPPGFYAEPYYIAFHQFVGRQTELQALSDWANKSDPANLLLFEAIGGNGKSMLTWEWAKDEKQRYATKVRSDWAGRFWYSFYERGAVMDDFCRRALAYMTRLPLENFEKRKTTAMRDELIAQLRARPWLVILDGLERVLVAYHRIDAAEVPDEEANSPTDKVLARNPCDAIRDEDADLLRALTACAPSKILVSSRLTPRVLLNPAGKPIPGVRRITLPGLRPLDAEELLRSCGVTGSSLAIREYLQQNCDNHPLVIGILAGLINKPRSNRSDFDAWSTAPDGGAALNLAQLDLIQRRNHILLAAIAALPTTGRQLLSTLALLSESADYETVESFNPHLPPKPDEIPLPVLPNSDGRWKRRSDKERAELRKQYEAQLSSRAQYEQALEAWQCSAGVRSAPRLLTETIHDLEQRGLLQYDERTQRYDLHPVVRSVAVGSMKSEDKQRHGQRVVDHFSSRPHRPFEQAQSLEDVRSGLHVVRTLLKLGHFQQAVAAYQGGLAHALLVNLEAYSDVLSLLRPYFSAGWSELLVELDKRHALVLANHATIALTWCREYAESLAAGGIAVQVALKLGDLKWLKIILTNLSENLCEQNLIAKAIQVNARALNLATMNEDADILFVNRLFLFDYQSRVGQWQAAESTWRLLIRMGLNWSLDCYRKGDAEYLFARWQFWRGTIQEADLSRASSLAWEDHNRLTIRNLYRLQGAWRLERCEWLQAADSFQEAVRMARECRLVDAESETGLALAKIRLGQLALEDAKAEATRLAGFPHVAHRYLALVWQAIGDADQTKRYALAAYKWAWADGEPFVNRYEVTKAAELLRQIDVQIPILPRYDPTKDVRFFWEGEVRALMGKLRAKQKPKRSKKKNKQNSDWSPLLHSEPPLENESSEHGLSNDEYELPNDEYEFPYDEHEFPNDEQDE